MARIDLAKTRARLAQRDMPYWRALSRGRAIGYRNRGGLGSWMARLYSNGKLRHKVLGAEADLSYQQAVERANDWFAREFSEAPRGYDVLASVEDYARTKSAEARRPEAARVWTDLRGLAKHIPGELLRRELLDLKTAELERWRDAMPVKPATRRRVFSVLVAALNNSYRLHGAGDPAAWRRVRAVRVPTATRARLFIPTGEQLKDLLAACEPDFALLIRGALHTACRYGELAALEVRDFDAKRGTLNLRVSKTGPRQALLSSSAVEFFKDRCRAKTPHARVFLTAAGEPWSKSMQHKRMRSATKIRAFVFYSLRHAALSRQLSAGIPSAVVAKNAGTSESMLRAHYHKFIDADRAAFDRVPALAE